jgi:hypothetical protein
MEELIVLARRCHIPKEKRNEMKGKTKEEISDE